MNRKHRPLGDAGFVTPLHPEFDRGVCVEAQDLDRLWVFDFESAFRRSGTQTLTFADGTVWHIPKQEHLVNLVIVQHVLSGRQLVYKYDLSIPWENQTSPMARFVKDFLYDKSMNKDGFEKIVIAHNMSGYDGRLVIDHLIQHIAHKNKVPELMWRGLKLMRLKVPSFFIMSDSLLHIPAGLAKLPKIFGLDENEFKKGYFPYEFNVHPSDEHYNQQQTYVGAIPAKEYYGYERMGRPEKQTFDLWYNQQLDKPFEFEKELFEYCESDVRILRQAVLVYCQETMVMTSLNPMVNMTIASFAQVCYRMSHMPQDSIAVLDQDDDKRLREIAFYGGRTDVRRLYRQYTPDDVARGIYAMYLDVQSLYPHVMINTPMPVGLLYKDPLEPMNSWDVLKEKYPETAVFFFRCRVIAYEHHPILMERVATNERKKVKKLVASLDIDETVVRACTRRELTAMLEVSRAYEIVEWLEVWYTLPRENCSLFGSYIKTFLQAKIEYSGYKGTEEAWDEFAMEHAIRFGIILKRDKMIPNAGRKQIAKLMLNSLWGKFAFNREKTSTCKLFIGDGQIEEERKLRDDLDHQRKKWINPPMELGSGGMSAVVYMYQDKHFDRDRGEWVMNPLSEQEHMASKHNIFLALHVTAHGRMELWDQLHLLGERVHYHDTDSVIFERDPMGYNVTEGKYLGEWENEHPGKPITSFVSLGPKTYSYRVLEKSVAMEEYILHRDELDALAGSKQWVIERWPDHGVVWFLSEHTKAKGFPIRGQNRERVHFESMLELLKKERDVVETVQLLMKYKFGGGIMSTDTIKQLRMSYDKGCITDDYLVRPFGWDKFMNP